MWKSDKLQRFLSEKKNIFLLYGISIIIVCFLAFSSCTPKPSEPETSASHEKAAPDLAAQLETILADMAGVGRVHVAVTYDSTAETVPAVNTGNESETVVTVGSGTNTRMAVTKEIMPRVRGVIVICDGGGNTTVRENVLYAVQALSGAPAHSIAVFAAKP